jgi:hypothetical protein
MFDAIDRLIQRVRVKHHDNERLTAIARRNLKRQAADANTLADKLVDRIAFNVPLKPRDECPEMSDAEYKKHVTDVVKYREFVLWSVLGLMERSATEEIRDDDPMPRGGLDF